MTTTIATLTEGRLEDARALTQQFDLGVRLDITWLRRLTLDDPTCRPELLLLAQDGGAPIGLCVGALREGKGVIKLFGVAARHRRRGVGTALFDTLEERLRELGAGEVWVEGASPSYLLPGVELTHTDAITFLLRRGYQTDRNARVDMVVHLHRVDLDTRDVAARLSADGITLKRAEGEEIAATAAMAREMFSANWGLEVSEAARFAPAPLFIARAGGHREDRASQDSRIVGFAAYDVNGPSRFGPTGTDPAFRQRGIGGALLKECLRSLRDRGEDIAEIGWAGPIGFYARAVSARIHRAYWGFRKTFDAGEQA